MISQTGEENYYSTSSDSNEDSDTMESIDEALPPKLNINMTKKTNSLNQYKRNSICLIQSLEHNTKTTCGIAINAKERSNSPKINF